MVAVVLDEPATDLLRLRRPMPESSEDSKLPLGVRSPGCSRGNSIPRYPRRVDLDAIPPNNLAARLREICPHATHLMTLLGENVGPEFLSGFANTYGTEWLQKLTSPELVTSEFSGVWTEVHGRRYWELLELLLVEYWISAMPAAVAGFLAPPLIFDKTLHTIRGAVGLALYSRAKSLNWQEPLTFVRALRVAESYLSAVVENGNLTKIEAVPQFEGRLGVSLVLQARFTDLSFEAVERMINHLTNSIAAGNDVPESQAFLLEAHLRWHDVVGGDEPLVVLLKRHAALETTSKSPQADSHAAEAWLRLSHLTPRPENAAKARLRASNLLHGLLSGHQGIDFSRAAIIAALIDSGEAYASGGEDVLLPVRGLRVPFGLKSQVRVWQDIDATATRRYLNRIATRFEAAPRAIATDPIRRRILASVHSNISQSHARGTAQDERRQHLRTAIDLRSDKGKQRALHDPESGLENALDLFDLHRLTGDRSHLVAGLLRTLALIEFDQAWPTPLLLLAREIERMPEGLPVEVVYQLRASEGPVAVEPLQHVLQGDSASLYALAASRALTSREVDRKNIGGRRGVYLAEDYSGVLADTFVFKPTTSQLARRETERAERIAATIHRNGLGADFSVAATLAMSTLPADDVLRQHAYDVIVARQYHAGVLLADALAPIDLGQKTQVLAKVARFLGLIHACEFSTDDAQRGMRRDLWKKELGRWLKMGLKLDNSAEVFDRWWQLLPRTVPDLPRRDAHPFNWIVTAGNGIVALDLEACGWRPAGYELAQLIDDHPLLPLDDAGWEARRHLLKVYCASLRRHGLRVQPDQVMPAFEASLMARSVGLLTSPKRTRESRQHGELILKTLQHHSKDAPTRELALFLHRAHSVRRGTSTSLEHSYHEISDARRRHLSRAMSYELRHGETVLLDAGGWAYAASVADALNRAGLHTTKHEVMAVASAMDESRFEVNGARLRALYGHTRAVEIRYGLAEVPDALYHGTAFRNLNAIFSSGEGLLPMSRNWVHLSSDPVQALRTARRHGPGVLLMIKSALATAPIYAAGGSVYLVTEVPAAALRIVTPAELFVNGISVVNSGAAP